MRGKEVGILFYPNDYFVTFSLELDEFLRLFQLEVLLGNTRLQLLLEPAELVETRLDVGRVESTMRFNRRRFLTEIVECGLVGRHLEERQGWGWVEKEDE